MAEGLLTDVSPWSRRLWLRVAGITVALVTGDPELTLGVRRASEAFLVDGCEPDAMVRVAWEDLAEEAGGERIFDSGGPWQLFSRDGGYRFSFTSPALGRLPYKVASFSEDFSSGEVRLHRPFFPPDQAVYPLEYPLDELLLLNLLAQGRGVEVHACGVVDASGRGLLFVGQSGAGKTTMARLWHRQPGVTVLSDDRIILRRMGTEVRMYGTPWHGEAEFACPADGRLGQVFFLHHGPTNRLAPQGGIRAVARLFAASFPPFHSAPALDFTLGFLAEVADAVPSHKLRFRPDASVIELVQAAVNAR
jgi:hypothetical protein